MVVKERLCGAPTRVCCCTAYFHMVVKDGSEGRESVIVVHQQGEELWYSLNSDGSERKVSHL